MLPNIINARSPFILSVNVTGSSNVQILIYLWNGTGSAPTSPTYILSKNIPSPTNFLVQFNISPYVKEFLDHAERQNVYGTYPLNTADEQWCNVYVDRIVDGDLLPPRSYLGLDGYGFYSEGENPFNGYFLLDQTTFYYPFNIANDPASDLLRQVGQLTLWADVDYSYKYINLITSTETTGTFTNSGFQDIPCVIDVNIPEGNLLEIFDENENRLANYIFKPQEECYYNPITIDFVNKYGAWQRTFMFKASYRSLEVSNTEYNLLQADLLEYDIQEGQRKTFNTNGNDKIKMNSGWVDASYSDVLKQLMLSNRILVNGSPAICLTKTLDIQDSLNINLINYQIEFKYAYDTINSVI